MGGARHWVGPVVWRCTALLALLWCVRSEGEPIRRGSFLNGKWVSYPPSAHDCATSVAELSALHDLRTRLKVVDDWDARGPCPCLHLWRGVECDSHGRIVAIDLSLRSLDGVLSTFTAWDKLVHTRILRLDGNAKLRGSIPLSLSKLTKLQELYLHNTGLEGSMPKPVENLRRLEIVFVDTPERKPNADISATLSAHKQVFYDSPYSDKQKLRDPEVWTGSLGGLDETQDRKTAFAPQPKSGGFQQSLWSDAGSISHQEGPIKLPPPS